MMIEIMGHIQGVPINQYPIVYGNAVRVVDDVEWLGKGGGLGER